ncbi:DUF899 domain-containing protein [Marinivivus vitaminiproducens]|uniref:DUF899 domain-containing protein n=1 Tax=Marinivivus vitaminiproducens TaxID=3035935 RepID=UPI0027A96283|nr:thioredoxin family protein [Geminicoccaceae bacterium SCSIO 64248]
MDRPRIVTPDEWLAARTALLAEEKELTRARDRMLAKRRALPWVRIEKDYRFEGPDGEVGLADLFEGRSQLYVYHFMFAPDWDEGCVGCSFMADHVDGARRHFEQNDLSFIAVSRAPFAKIDAFRRRMGWTFRWLSSHGSDFNYDFHVSFRPEEIASGKVTYNYRLEDFECEELSGASVFVRDEAGHVFHTYSTFGRGDEGPLGAYAFLDLAPKGRNEHGPGFNLTDWVRLHDRYEAGGASACACDADPA